MSLSPKGLAFTGSRREYQGNPGVAGYWQAYGQSLGPPKGGKATASTASTASTAAPGLSSFWLEQQRGVDAASGGGTASYTQLGYDSLGGVGLENLQLFNGQGNGYSPMMGHLNDLDYGEIAHLVESGYDLGPEFYDQFLEANLSTMYPGLLLDPELAGIPESEGGYGEVFSDPNMQGAFWRAMNSGAIGPTSGADSEGPLDQAGFQDWLDETLAPLITEIGNLGESNTTIINQMAEKDDNSDMLQMLMAMMAQNNQPAESTAQGYYGAY